MNAFLQRLFAAFIPFLISGTLLSAKEVFLTTGTRTFEQDQPGGSASRTMVTFNYGEVQITMPRTANWVENPMLLRPQLLLLRCGPLSSPSMVHIELLANRPRASGSGLYVRLVEPTWMTGAYQNQPGMTLMKPSLIPRITLASFQKTPVNGASLNPQNQPREEIHILQAGELGLRMRMVLSPQLDPKNETAIRRSLSQLIVRAQSLGSKAEETAAAVEPQPVESVTPSTATAEPPSHREETDGYPSSETVTATTGTTETPTESDATAKVVATPAESPSAPSVFVTLDARIKKLIRPENGGFTTMLAFDFGGVVINLPKVANWVENAAVRRPQLLHLSHMGNLSSPSYVVLELVGRDVIQQANGVVVHPEDPQKIAQPYQNSGWDVLSGMTLDPKLLLGSYRKTPSMESIQTERKEVYLLQVNGISLRLRLVLAPGLPAKEETAIRAALSKLSIQITSRVSTPS